MVCLAIFAFSRFTFPATPTLCDFFDTVFLLELLLGAFFFLSFLDIVACRVSRPPLPMWNKQPVHFPLVKLCSKLHLPHTIRVATFVAASSHSPPNSWQCGQGYTFPQQENRIHFKDFLKCLHAPMSGKFSPRTKRCPLPFFDAFVFVCPLLLPLLPPLLLVLLHPP